MRVAYLRSRDTVAADEAHQLVDLLGPAFAAADMELVPRTWDEPEPTEGCDVALIGPTWDYWEQPDTFLATLAWLPVPLHNPLPLVRWNIDKRYLRDLAAAGLPTLPTLWRTAGDSLEDVFDKLGTDTVVVKRVIGAGAIGQHRLERGRPLPELEEDVLVQPFVSTITTRGELSVLYIDGAYSHAVLKTPKAGDYRIQMTYGGVDRRIEADEPTRALCERVLAAVRKLGGSTPLYARIDLIWDEEGTQRLMEVELIEPYLYLSEVPELPAMLAEAVKARIATA